MYKQQKSYVFLIRALCLKSVIWLIMLKFKQAILTLSVEKETHVTTFCTTPSSTAPDEQSHADKP